MESEYKNFYTILFTLKDLPTSPDDRRIFISYVRRLTEARVTERFCHEIVWSLKEYDDMANIIWSLIVRGVDYNLLESEYVVGLSIVYAKTRGIFTVKDIANYYERFYQRSRQIYYEERKHQEGMEPYLTWIKHRVISPFLSALVEYAREVVKQKLAALQIWSEYKEDWDFYLQWPPEEVMADVLDLLPSFEDKFWSTCPKPQPIMTMFGHSEGIATYAYGNPSNT